MGITDGIKSFSKKYEKEVVLPHSKNLVSYKLLVDEIPSSIQSFLDTEKFSFLSVKGSIGIGVNTYYPWIGIFDNRVSKGATNGYYVVLLFSDDFKDVYLTLNQGSTTQPKEVIEHNIKLVYDQVQSIEGFIKNQIPINGLVKTKTYGVYNKGAKYEKSTMFYKKYSTDGFTEKQFQEDLIQAINAYQKCASMNRITKSSQVDCEDFYADALIAGLRISKGLIENFISLLCTKPFVILTGLSGSGKTKLAQAFAKWITEGENQICFIPVGADWTNREPLLGYPNALELGKYIKSENGVVDLLIEANKEQNSGKPFFLILDEMNLSHVERYFADFLSAMESKEAISLHPCDKYWKDDVPAIIHIPDNFYVIGTVNVDETTYMFSPKVLDRAGILEFRVTEREMTDYLKNPERLNLNSLTNNGLRMAESFIRLSNAEVESYPQEEYINSVLSEFFVELKRLGSEFGYRTASEIFRFGGIMHELNKSHGEVKPERIADAAIMQKLLPKVHGSRRKLEPVLKTLIGLCLYNRSEYSIEEFLKPDKNDFQDDENVRFPVSLEKLIRMYNRVIQDGFTSFAEA